MWIWTVKHNRSTSDITLHNSQRARFLPPIKIIGWNTIASRLELDRQKRNDHHKFIGEFDTPVAISSSRVDISGGRPNMLDL